MAAFLPAEDGNHMQGLISSRRFLKFEDFEIDKFLQEGGYGKVYSATRKSDGLRVAMKFFGYTRQKPDVEEIRKEVALMIRLDKVDGVCQMVGLFNDTAEGLVPDKFPAFKCRYPVIVMELLQGGDMFNRISTRSCVTESYLAETFLSAMWALRSIHERGYIHRDLKLDNLMLVSPADPSQVKIIDFGMLVYLPYPALHLTSPKSFYGTDGYFAPETLLNFDYSYKTDIWQAGCILYAMLAGHPPFHPDVKYRGLCAKGKYYPLKGPNWDSISAEAKDLVARMLTKDPAARIDMDGICHHPWLLAAQARSSSGSSSSGAEDSEHALGEAYTRRIKNLVLKNKLKKCFIDTNIESDTKNRRANFAKTLSMSSDKLASNPFDVSGEVEGEKRSYCVGIADYVKTKEYNAKLLKVRAALVQHIYKTQQEAIAVEGQQRGHSTPKTSHIDLNFDEFCGLMRSSELELLASAQVFALFDVDGNGYIDVKEFLLALISLRKPSVTDEDEQDAAQLYFSVFDLDEDKHICKDELALVLDCLLHDGAGHVFLDEDAADGIDEMFNSIDIDGNGLITFDEFKHFYDTILKASTVDDDEAA